MKYIAVVLDLAVDKTLDYSVPEGIEIAPGMRVEVPVRGKPTPATILHVLETPSFPKVKSLIRVLHPEPLLSSERLELAIWMARYYCCCLRDVFQVMLPATLRKNTEEKRQLYVIRQKTREEIRAHLTTLQNKSPAQAAILEAMLNVTKGILLTELLELTEGSRSPVETLAKQGWLSLDSVRVDRSPLQGEDYFPTKPKILNPEQQDAVESISSHLGTFAVHLLYGITGSGKTEVYLQTIQKALDQGLGVILLVPEISLTAQTIQRFRSRFPDTLAILHHRLSEGERRDEWHRIQKGEARIVIGARSAVFSPVAKLGIIIVDEEHESSYKQTESAPCYHARDVAVMRGKMEGAVVVLGSATPSLESYANAQAKKYTLNRLSARADAASLPKVTIVDMKREFDKAKGLTSFSDPLLQAIEKRLSKGEQILLFLNRRGYHTSLVCPGCGECVKCNHCDVSLTFHYQAHHLSCHLCGYTIQPPSQCSQCKSPHPMKYRGAGTEHVERTLHAILPAVRTLRLDADTTRHKGSHQKLLREFGSGKADVLIGTQMIAKGLHFPEVTLVGVLNADASLQIPDFRASETTFQLLTQVAGRAGRGALAGEVIVQTSMPDHPLIALAAQHDYDTFFNDEVESRKLFLYPPFTTMARVILSGESAEKTEAYGNEVKGFLIRHLPHEFQVHPVVAAGHAKVKDRYRFHCIVRGPQAGPLCRVFQQVNETLRIPHGVHQLVDINPQSTFF